MKYKQKVDITIALLLIITGSVILALPLFDVNNIRVVSIIVFGVYTALNIIQYILTYKSKDIEGIISAVASLVALVAIVIYNPTESPRTLAMILMTWEIIMSLAKLLLN